MGFHRRGLRAEGRSDGEEDDSEEGGSDAKHPRTLAEDGARAREPVRARLAARRGIGLSRASPLARGAVDVGAPRMVRARAMESSRAPSAPIDLAGRADWAAIFGRTAPIEVEVGAGMGGFALGYAAARPETNLVAIEIRKKLAADIGQKAEKRGLANLLVLQGDAKVLLPRLFAPRSVERFHVQFPDPWWKSKHHDRRLVEDRFSILLYNLLRVGGTIELRTDVEARGVEMDEALEAIGFVNRFGTGGLAPYDPAQVPSSRERGYLARGQPVYRYVLERTEAPPHHAAAPLSPTTVGTAQRRK